VQIMQNESSLLQRLDPHPNIVRWVGYYTCWDRIALVLELVRDGDCQQLLQRHGCLSEEAVRPMISQLYDALGHLHERGVIHRDVKLENCLCDTQVFPPKITLCDLGHACYGSSVKGNDNFFGTPGYAAPEVLRGPRWSHAADVWAAGVVMYCLLANSLPFGLCDRSSTISQSIFQPPPMSGRSWWQVSTEAKVLLLQILEPSTPDRLDLDAVRDSDWLRGEASSGRRATPRLQRSGYSHQVLSSFAEARPKYRGGLPSNRSAGSAMDALADKAAPIKAWFASKGRGERPASAERAASARTCSAGTVGAAVAAAAAAAGAGKGGPVTFSSGGMLRGRADQPERVETASSGGRRSPLPIVHVTQRQLDILGADESSEEAGPADSALHAARGPSGPCDAEQPWAPPSEPSGDSDSRQLPIIKISTADCDSMGHSPEWAPPGPHGSPAPLRVAVPADGSITPRHSTCRAMTAESRLSNVL